MEAVDDDPQLSPLSFTATSTYADGNITLTVHALNSDLSSNQLYSVVIEAGNRARRINSIGVIQLSKLLCQMRVLHASTKDRYSIRSLQRNGDISLPEGCNENYNFLSMHSLHSTTLVDYSTDFIHSCV